MFKRTLIAVALLAGSSVTTYAAQYKGEAMPMSMPAQTYFQVDPYVGVGLGALNSFFRSHDLAAITNPTTGTTSYFTYGNMNGIYEIYAGYGGLLNRMFYLAGEIFADNTFNSRAKTVTDDGLSGTTINTKIRASYGISILPGILLTDQTVGFIRLGARRTNFNTTTNGDAGFVGTINTNRTGFDAGLGLLVALTHNWDLRGEYIYTSYNSFTTPPVAAAAPTTGYNIKPTSGQFVLSTDYRFG